MDVANMEKNSWVFSPVPSNQPAREGFLVLIAA
jgi:hypothetical protein